MSAGKRFSAKFLPVLFWSTSANWGNSCMLGFSFSICCPFTGRLSGFEQMCTAEPGRVVRVPNPLLLMEEQKQKQMRRRTCLLAKSEGSLAWKERLMRSIQEGDELVERSRSRLTVQKCRFGNSCPLARSPPLISSPCSFSQPLISQAREGGKGGGKLLSFCLFFVPFSDSRFDHFWGLTINAMVETLMAARLCKW